MDHKEQIKLQMAVGHAVNSKSSDEEALTALKEEAAKLLIDTMDEEWLERVLELVKKKREERRNTTEE